MSNLKYFLTRHSVAAVAGLATITLITVLAGCPVDTNGGAPGGGTSESKYTCENGTPIDGTTTIADTTGCQSCVNGFALTGTAGAGTECLVDTDNDNIANVNDTCPNVPNANDQTDGHACDTDIDNDDDGLIEIWTLEQLHNMRYDLTGASYKTSAAATADTTGASATEPANCNDGDAMTTVVLCGYELMQDLDFDLDGDGSTYTGTPASPTLDSGDDAAPYFTASTGGWTPIGDVDNSFNAIFDGNGFTVANIAIHRNLVNVAPFGSASLTAVVRNIGFTDVLVNNRRSASNTAAGGLVGFNNGSVIASYTTGNIVGGTGGRSIVGGLVGNLRGGSITASFSTSTVDGGMTESLANELVGGLVGEMNTGSITASYATGAVNGNGGDFDNVGGLVGGLLGGAITASYATGAVDGGIGFSDMAGSLIGVYSAGNIPGPYSIANYGFGTVTNNNGDGISTKPTGVTAATGLTLANTEASGCNSPIYTTQAACTSTSKAAGVWASPNCTPPSMGATAGVTYTLFSSQTACETTSKTASNWLTISWNDAGDDTLNAWVFATGKAPRLRYADYDGAGTDFDCSMFPAGVTCGANGDPLPGQPAQ